MDNVVQTNIEMASGNIEKLLKILSKNKYPIGIYRNKKELKDGIKFYDELLKRKESEA